MSYFVKIFIYSIFIYSMLLITSVIEINTFSPDYNYTMIVEMNSEQVIEEYATKNELNIYQKYSLSTNMFETPYYYNYNGGEFYSLEPHINYNVQGDTYYIEATEPEILEFTNYLDETNISYSLSEPFVKTSMSVRIFQIVAVIVATYLIILYSKFQVSKNKDMIYLKQINGVNKIRIFLEVEKKLICIIVSIIISIVTFITSSGYFSTFLLVSLIPIICLLLCIEYLAFQTSYKTNSKIKFINPFFNLCSLF